MSREIVDRLNELLECERAGVEAALGLGASGAPGFTHGELQKFAEDEGWACGGLRKAVRAEGVNLASYVRTPIHLRPRFQDFEFFGKGYPWKIPFADQSLVYRPGDCPNAERFCADHG